MDIYPKKIIDDNHGKINCMIKRYECKKCNKGFSADITNIVRKNFSVTDKVLDIVQQYYTVCFISVRKIQELMKEMHDIIFPIGSSRHLS